MNSSFITSRQGFFGDVNNTVWSSQLQVFEKVSPRCLCEGVSSIITPSIEIGGCIWKTEFLLRVISINNVLLGLKVASQLLAHMEVVLLGVGSPQQYTS